ncbi:ATP-binding protein [Rhodococcus sp. SGAir0479]|uniref:ATP-binding protein n=1 Tax=Rhodococcus sp. SGAir0479 TaxID=2567884 RepID=UPI0010CD2AE3|nr:AAA family ATPase [Rhodococcus sp. SGAir0479]QCQ91770.1 ATP-binding protein [Rhodococcus sp. SGAir0479]
MTGPPGGTYERNDGHLIKVLEVLDQGEAFLGRTSNGSIARFSVGSVAAINRGDVIFFSDRGWEIAPRSAWPELPEVAIVRRILEDGVLIEVGSSIRLLPGKPTIQVSAGNTVQFNDVDGITRILHDSPVRYRDSGVDDDGLNEYLVQLEEDGPGFDSFGGYHHVRDRAVELIETQLKNRDRLRDIGARQMKGVIFSGPPGTGKTHLARIIARESGAAFFLVSGPSIVSKWVGDSEETLRRIFEAASSEDRAIIFFDEIDSIAERRTSDSHEASKRVVAQLLTLLDGFDQKSSNVVVIAATNRISDIDDALLRPGRFDWEISFDLPTAQDRHEILEASARNLATLDDLPIAEVAALTDGWSAARLNSIWTEASLVAAGDNRSSISGEDLALAFERVASRPSRTSKQAEVSHVN